MSLGALFLIAKNIGFSCLTESTKDSGADKELNAPKRTTRPCYVDGAKGTREFGSSIIIMSAVASCITKVEEKAGSCNFFARQRQIFTEETSVHNFNVVPKFPKGKVFSPKFCIFGRKIW